MAPQDGQALMFLTLGPGKSLQESGQAVLQQNNLQLVDSREINVNGFNTLVIVADSKPDPQQQQQQYTPAPQPPGEVPPGKVWSVEHGHWHDAPSPLPIPPLDPAAVAPVATSPPAPAAMSEEKKE